MKNYISRLWTLTSVLLLATAFLLPVTQATAGANTMALNSTAASATEGSLFLITLTLNATDPIDAVEGYVTFNPAQVEFVSADYTGSSWPNDTSATSVGSNYYVSSRFRTPPFSTGVSTIVRLTFKALASSGTTTFGISEDQSYALTGGNDMLSGVSGVSVGLEPTGPQNPGTVVIVSSDTGSNPAPTTTASTAADPNTNNGTPVTDPAVLTAAATEGEQAAQQIAKELENKYPASTRAKAKLPTVPLAVLSGIIVLGLGFIIARQIMGHRQFSSVSKGDDAPKAFIGGMNNKADVTDFPNSNPQANSVPPDVDSNSSTNATVVTPDSTGTDGIITPNDKPKI
jgi:hypothetical protein